MVIFRKNNLYGVKINENCDKKRVMLKFCLQQNFSGFLFNLIRRSLEFFRVSRKNRDDFWGFGLSRLMRGITTSRVSPLLVMTIQKNRLVMPDEKEAAGILGSCVASPRMTDEKEVAGILGSCVASPRMTVEKGYCHLEPRAIARGCKDLINKCRDCIELTRLKQVRIKLKRDLYGDFACAQPLKMTMIICFVLCLGVAGEARAACNTGDFSCNGSPTDYCCWRVVSTDADGKRTAEIYRDPAAPADAIASVGQGAFDITRASRNALIASISKVDIKEGITVLKHGSFYLAPNLTEVSAPYVTTIGSLALGANKLTSLDLPNAQTVDDTAFYGSAGIKYIGLPENAEVNINTNRAYGLRMNCTVSNGYKICGTCDDYVKSGTGCVKDCGRGYLGKNGKCINSALGCGNGYKDMGGFCNRVRYTPAEAAAVANDDNTNVVTITFKKQ